MKNDTDKPVKEEATPLFVGGEAAKPRMKRRWGRVIVILAVLVVAAGAFAGWWLFLRADPNDLDISKLDSNNKYVALAQKFKSEPMPTSPKDKAIYYGNIAAMLKSAKQYKYAERYYLLAQKTVDENNVDKKDVEFYQGLSDLYKAMGNKKKADEYAKKEEDFLKANYPADVLEQMKKAKLNDPVR